MYDTSVCSEKVVPKTLVEVNRRLARNDFADWISRPSPRESSQASTASGPTAGRSRPVFSRRSG